MIVVSDTSPINYLILIGQIDLLPQLFRQIVIPQEVYSELSDTAAPNLVRTWIETPPGWLKIQLVNQASDESVDLLDPGERGSDSSGSRTQRRLDFARRYESTTRCKRERFECYRYPRNFGSGSNHKAHRPACGCPKS